VPWPLPEDPRTRDETQLVKTLRTFRVVHARRGEIVVRRGHISIVFRQLEPHRAAVLFRRGLLDEAPVPLGDIRAALADATVKGAVRITPLAAVDALDASRLPVSLREALSATADRRDYALLVPEDPHAAAPSPPARVFRAVQRTIPSLPRIGVRIRVEGDGTLRYGATLLVAAWRGEGLDVRLSQRDANASFARVSPPRGIVVARAVDARFVSPRVRGWREDTSGVVDYARVTVR
jgi:hypothetical protein